MVFVFDFDGVIFDTLDETLFISFNVYMGISPLSTQQMQPLNGINDTYKRKFAKFRYLVADPFQFKLLWDAIENVTENEIEDCFFQLLEEDQKGNVIFKKKLFAFREELKKSHLQTWLSLCRPYQSVVNCMKTMNKKIPVYISSNKDESSIHFLLIHAGIYIPQERVFGKEHGPDKSVHLKEISRHSERGLDDLLFIDDNFKNFDGISELGVRCYLATWGYNNPAQNEKTVKSAYTLINQRELPSILK